MKEKHGGQRNRKFPVYVQPSEHKYEAISLTNKGEIEVIDVIIQKHPSIIMYKANIRICKKEHDNLKMPYKFATLRA